MRKTFLFLLFPFVLLLTGCDDQARSFAKQTKAILMQRSAQISKEIAAEVKAYNEVAALSAQDHHTIAVDSLQNERAVAPTPLQRITRTAANRPRSGETTSLPTPSSIMKPTNRCSTPISTPKPVS